MIKAVFFDIDGTLLTSRHQVLSSTVQAIHCLKQQHIITGVATGRSFRQLPKAIKALPFDYFVTCNGQYIVNHQHHVCYEQALDARDVAKVLQYADDHYRHVQWHTQTKTYGSWLMAVAQMDGMLPLVHRAKKHIQHMSSCWYKRLGKRQYIKYYNPDESVYQLVLFQPKEEDDVLRHYWPHLRMTRSNPFTVDIVNHSVSKAFGIQKVLEKDQLSLQNVLFFGDNYNDIEVMQTVKYGVAMANAIPELQCVASFTTASNDQHGIAIALQYFHLLDREELL